MAHTGKGAGNRSVGRKQTSTSKSRPSEKYSGKKAGAKQASLDGFFDTKSNFALFSRLIARDLNNNPKAPTFSRYTKDDINTYISNPYRYQKQIREAVQYIYGASSHFRRLIHYFVALSDLAYVVEPYRIDPQKANPKTVRNNYRKVLNVLSAMSIKTQFPKILRVCLTEDVYYCTMIVTADSISLMQLPSEYCDIAVVEGNVCNVSFNFSYFDARADQLDFFPDEFRKKYNQYRNNRTMKWIELDSPTSFAIKCNNDILEYALPPFIGILRDIYDIEDYKILKKTKTELENYALLMMKLPMSKDGEWLLDFDKAQEFWAQLAAIMPEQVGLGITPMDIAKYDFDHSNTADTSTVADAEDELFTAAGVSSLLFNNPKASANALLLSMKIDQAMTFGIVKSIQDAVNRYIQSLSFGKNWKVEFLDVSPINRKEMGDAYLKASSYGIPMISFYAASQGLNQAELDSMSYLEGTILELHKMFKPLRSSTQMSSSDLDSKAATDEGGAPKKEVGDISESGEVNQENA